MTCSEILQGHPQIYGLGIRLSFYLLWFAILAFNWLPAHLRGGFIALRIMLLVFSFAVFIGLGSYISSSSASSFASYSSSFPPSSLPSREVTAGVSGEGEVRVIAGEVYVTLLLISSGIYFLLPLYLCRVITCCLGGCCCCRLGACWCGGSWEETDYLLVRNNSSGRETPSSAWEGTGILVPLLEFIFLLLVIGMQFWFWWSGVGDLATPATAILEAEGCYGYGFLFGKASLDDSNFRALNSVVVLAVLGGVVIFSGMDAGVCGSTERNRRRRKRKRKR